LDIDQRPLESSRRSQHDARRTQVILQTVTGRGDILMLERAIPVPHPRIALDDERLERKPAAKRAGLRTLKNDILHALRTALRSIGRFIEAGGPLS
jgi:hypothetical protein